MADSPEDSPERKEKTGSRPFGWQTLFQRSPEPIFLLSRQRRLLFVNGAWEELTGRLASEVRGLACRRHREAEPDSWEALAGTLLPPPEVLAGRPGRIRRLLPRPDGKHRWCDVDFFPVGSSEGPFALVGKITPIGADVAAEPSPLLEELSNLREGHAQLYRFEYLSSQSIAPAHLRRTLEQARLASQTRVPLLIVGESGTGKQWLARAIHYQGPYREAPFVALDCAHLPPGALAVLLFGAGGLAWRTDVGTLYLREPSRLPRDLQDRICTLIADATGRGPRVIAGCCPDPAGLPRDELHCALGTLVLELPPLRDRPAASLPWLVERLLQRACGDAPPMLTPEAWELVYSYHWPGNVRELYAVLAGAWARQAPASPGTRIDAADLPAFLRLAATPGAAPVRPLPLQQLLDQAERRLIGLALRMAQGNKTRAAEILSEWRPRLLRRMQRLGLMVKAGKKKKDKGTADT